jgi:hypothetical protein
MRKTSNTRGVECELFFVLSCMSTMFCGLTEIPYLLIVTPWELVVAHNVTQILSLPVYFLQMISLALPCALSVSPGDGS